MDKQPLLYWKIDECSRYFDRMLIGGWCYHPTKTITGLALRLDTSGEVFPLRSFGSSSADVAAFFGARAEHVRFGEWIQGSSHFGTPFSLIVRFADGSEQTEPDGLTNAASGDPYYQSWENFLAKLGELKSGAVLEIGSRARSAISRRHRIPAALDYVGLDILEGPNVDVVGDAHELRSLFKEKRFVAAFSTSVFEHLLMPWKVVAELSHVLAPGALVYTATHQTWPLHEEPWDFWRYSKHSWRSLFNSATGFEVLDAVMGEPARIHAIRTSEVTREMPSSPAYLGTACLAQKVSAPCADWPSPREIGAKDAYPQGELERRPTSDPV